MLALYEEAAERLLDKKSRTAFATAFGAALLANRGPAPAPSFKSSSKALRTRLLRGKLPVGRRTRNYVRGKRGSDRGGRRLRLGLRSQDQRRARRRGVVPGRRVPRRTGHRLAPGPVLPRAGRVLHAVECVLVDRADAAHKFDEFLLDDVYRDDPRAFLPSTLLGLFVVAKSCVGAWDTRICTTCSAEYGDMFGGRAWGKLRGGLGMTPTTSSKVISGCRGARASWMFSVVVAGGWTSSRNGCTSSREGGLTPRHEDSRPPAGRPHPPRDAQYPRVFVRHRSATRPKLTMPRGRSCLDGRPQRGCLLFAERSALAEFTQGAGAARAGREKMHAAVVRDGNKTGRRGVARDLGTTLRHEASGRSRSHASLSLSLSLKRTTSPLRDGRRPRA